MQNPDQSTRVWFSKQLTQVEVEKRLVLFPLSAVAGIFNNLEEGRLFCIDVVDSTGMAWSFLGSLRTNEELGSVFSIHWPQFATEKDLKANDEVVFVVRPPHVDDRAPGKKFKVEVKRKIRLFGQDIWGNPMV